MASTEIQQYLQRRLMPVPRQASTTDLFVQTFLPFQSGTLSVVTPPPTRSRQLRSRSNVRITTLSSKPQDGLRTDGPGIRMTIQGLDGGIASTALNFMHQSPNLVENMRK